MDIAWTTELVDQLEFQWGRIFRPRTDSLTDEQYLREPVSGGGLDLLDRRHDAWVNGVSALEAGGLAQPFGPCGPSEGPYAAYPMAALVSHVHREGLHHAAEIALLLDLFARAAVRR